MGFSDLVRWIHGTHAVTAPTRRLLSWRANWEKETTVASHGDSPPPPLRDVSRCVVLSRGDDVSPGFLASLKRHGIDAIVIGRPLLAFAELLCAERSRTPGGGWGLPERNRTALIVADRDRWERLDDLLTAVRVRLPNVAVWVAASDLLLEVSEPVTPLAEESSLPDVPRLRLTTDGGPDASAGHHSNEPEPPPPSASAPPSGEPREQEPDRSRSPRAQGPISSAVTPEEIDMLLNTLPDEPTQPREDRQDPRDRGPRPPNRPEGNP